MLIQRALRSVCLLLPVTALALGCTASTETTASDEEALGVDLNAHNFPGRRFGPTRPALYNVQAYPTMVTVKWRSPDGSAASFDVQRRDINGNWQVVHTESNTPNKDYTWVDTDRSLSAQCYIVTARDSLGLGLAASTDEWCTVRPDSSVFPQSAPGFVAQWYGLSRVNDDVGTLVWGPGDLFLQLQNRTFGVNLGLGQSTGSPNVRAERRMPNSKWPLMQGEAIAIRVWGAGWLTYGHQTWGVNVALSDTPSYEWHVVGGAIGQSLDDGGFALYSEKANDFLVKAHQTWGVDLNWYTNTLPSTGGGGGGGSIGVSSLTVYNCISEQRPLEMWVWDATAGGGWVDKGKLDPQYNEWGACPETGSPWTFTPISSHSYTVKAIDFLAPGCGNDPTVGGCERQTTTFTGDSKGQPMVLTDG